MKILRLVSIAIAIPLSFLAASCHKDREAATPVGDFSKLQSGTWNWVLSTGGLMGGTFTPASTGTTLSRTFINDSICKTIRDGIATNEQYYTSQDSTWAPGQVTNWVNIAGSNYNMWYSHDTLVLTTNYVDGTTDYYIK